MSRRINACAAAALVLAGCATPDSVYQLAEVTSANVGVLGTRLKQLADESDRLFRQRAENVAHQHAANSQSRARYEYDLALTEKSGDSKDLQLKKDLEAWKAEVDAIFAAVAGAEQERRDALIAKAVKIDAKAGDLQKIAEALSTLAKEETAKERASSLRGFASEVAKAVKKELDSGSESASGAKALVDKVRGTKSAAAPINDKD